MPKKPATVLTIAAFLALPLAACDQTPTALSSGSGTASIQLAPSSDVATASLLGLFRLEGASVGNVSLDAVSSIDVTLQRVEALQLQAEGEASWVSLDVAEQDLNLLDLPEDGIEVARGELAAGDYCNVRFFVGDATITFSENVTLGAGATGMTFEAETPHDLFIPSAAHTGLKVPTARFTVDEEQENLTIGFDAGESVQTVNLTGTGVLMTPVLTPENGEDIPECDAVEEDGENGADDGENGSTGGE